MPDSRAKPDPNLDLFAWRHKKAPAPTPVVLTVSQLNQQARNLLESKFSRVLVVGEISNYKRHASGHHYFSLKDRNAQLPAALFRREASRLSLPLRDGMEVVVTGQLTIYGRSGRYQIIVERVEPRGAGALQAAFDDLKRRLAQEGLFENEHKRGLPRVPRRVAVVTSQSGVVFRDIVNVATRRFPDARLLLVPAPVQGANAAPAIAGAIARVGRLSARYQLDVLIVARGGGSLEDLWGFNEERVARAIAQCSIPVVSAVGHETDFTIADFVADCRASTPSAAAELVFPVRQELVEALRRRIDRAARGLRRTIEERRLRLDATRARLGDGRGLLREPQQEVSDFLQRLKHSLRQRLVEGRLRLRDREKRLALLHPQVRLRGFRERLHAANQRLVLAARQHLHRERREQTDPVRLAGLMRQRIAAERRDFFALNRRLDALSPVRVLERGYAIVLGPKGTAVTGPTEVQSGDRLKIRVAKGEIAATVRGQKDTVRGQKDMEPS